MTETSKYLAAALLLVLLPPLHRLSGEVQLPAPLEWETVVVGGDSFVAQNGSLEEKYWVLVTGYSSTPEETDETPFLTAANTETREGVVAANFLPFGTKIRIPEIFGDRVFVVEDRMHSKNGGKVDVWFAAKEEALEFGVRSAVIEIL